MKYSMIITAQTPEQAITHHTPSQETASKDDMQSAVKVLIVEDEPHALMGLAELISGWGYRTETARDGIEGWEKSLTFDPAIVVTDMKMPRMDGIGLLTKLAESANSNVAVVLLTAQGSIQMAVDAMKLELTTFCRNRWTPPGCAQF